MKLDTSVPREPGIIKARTDDWYNPRLRRNWLLGRLAEADGIIYDDLCRAVIEAFPHAHPQTMRGKVRGVRSVRDLLWDGLAVTEPDESVWLTPEGWRTIQRRSAFFAAKSVA